MTLVSGPYVRALEDKNRRLEAEIDRLRAESQIARSAGHTWLAMFVEADNRLKAVLALCDKYEALARGPYQIEACRTIRAAATGEQA